LTAQALASTIQAPRLLTVARRIPAQGRQQTGARPIHTVRLDLRE